MKVVSDGQKSQPVAPVARYDVVVVGAGPYGLSAAAHLLGRGLKVAIFGKPLELWRDHMPKGMLLRSHWWASNLSDPQKKYSFGRYLEANHYKKSYPTTIEIFIDYALWFQKNAAPHVDETYVSQVEHHDKEFLLTLADGRCISSQAVVMAPGLYYYMQRPDSYSHLSPSLVSHSCEHNDFSRFKGKTVVVIGAGQGAVEYSALLQEVGATVHIVARRPIFWLAPDRTDERSLFEQMLMPNAGIAPGWRNWLLESLPYLFYHFPQARKDRYIRSHYLAAASDWLRERVIGKVLLYEGRVVVDTVEVDGKVNVTISDGETVRVDHIMLATGYTVNIKKLPMLHPALFSEIKMDKDVPILNSWFESSVPGLYFIGITSLRSFGPLYRFVVGCKAAAPRVARSVARFVKVRR